MTVDDRIEALSALLSETEAAHGVYEATVLGGVYDKAWAEWYAAYAVEHGIGDLVGRVVTADELARFLASTFDEFRAADPRPTESWRAWTARRVAIGLQAVQPPSMPGSPGHLPYAAELEAERSGWYAVASLVRSLTPEECLVPGYYRDPDWTVRDLVAHLGTWLAEAALQLEQISAGTYEGHDIDVDTLNAQFLAAMAGQPWEVAWVQANAGRTRMVEEWSRLDERTDEAAWWIRKSGGDHYAEHLDRLREWAGELIGRRGDDRSP